MRGIQYHRPSVSRQALELAHSMQFYPRPLGLDVIHQRGWCTPMFFPRRSVTARRFCYSAMPCGGCRVSVLCMTRRTQLCVHQENYKVMGSNHDIRTNRITHITQFSVSNYDARTTRPPTHSLKVRDKLPSPVEHPSHLWRRNVAALAPTPKRCRLPGKRCRFEESTSLLIVETGLRFVTLVLSLVGIIMNTIHHRILKRSPLYDPVQTMCAHKENTHL